MEDEEESMADAKNVIADAFSHVSSSHRENTDAIFTCEKLDISDKLVNAINNLTINDTIYELNKGTVSDAQGDLTTNSDTDTHTDKGIDTVTRTNNGILDGKLLSFRTIGKFSASPPVTKPIVLVPQTLMTPAAKKIFTDTTSGNTCTNRTPRQVSRMGFGRTCPRNIGHACGISETSSPDLIGIIVATAHPVASM